MVFFPHMMTPVFVGRGRSLATVESIPPDVQRVFLVTQRDARQEEPEADDLFRVGTEAEIHQMIRLNDGAIKLLMEGVGRCQAVDFHTAYEGLWANLVRVEEPANTPVEELALSRALLAQLEDYLRLCHRIPHEVYAEVESMETPSAMADAVAACLPFKTADKQRLLEILDAGERMRALSSLIADEIELLKVERKLRGRVRRQMDRSQKEFFLNEQLRAIQRELGQPENLMGEGEELRQRTKGLRLPKEVAEKVDKEIQRLEMMTPLSPEASVVRNYVEWLLDVPWHQRTRGRNDLAEAAEILERDHYGLKKVKERIRRAHRGPDAQQGHPRAHPLPRGAAGGGKDLPGPEHRGCPGAEVRPRLAGGHPGRGRDPGAPADLHRRPAGAHHPVHEEGGKAQPRFPSGRGGQDERRLPG